MSMQVLTLFQLAQAFAAYTLAVLVLPWLFLRKRLTARSVEERLLAYFLAGNFYVIYLVFVLQFLHISNRFTLLLGTALPFVIVLLRRHHAELPEKISRLLQYIQQLLHGERRLKADIGAKPQLLARRAGTALHRWLRNNTVELLCFAVLCAALGYMYGLGVVTAYGYKASDVNIHTYWVNLMDENRMFHDGVYPHGFHCIIYYLEQVFGIPTYVLMRVMGFVETFYIHMALLVPLRFFCKSRYTPYAALLGYVLLDISPYGMFERFAAPLPQEYGMLFILPAGFFAIRFFHQQRQLLACQNADERGDAERAVQFDLRLFTIAFSLTLTIHTYDTVIAGLLCISIALAFIRQFLNWKYFKRIIGAGLVSIVLAALPLTIGVLEGNPLHGSLYWALGVANGTSEKEENSPSELSMKGLYYRLRNQVVNDPAQFVEGYGEVENDGVSTIVYIFVGINAAIFAFGLLEFLARKRKDHAAVLWTFGWLDLLLLILQEADLLGLPQLVELFRAAIYYLYFQPVVWALVLDELLTLVLRRKALVRAGAFMLTAAELTTILYTGSVRQTAGTYVKQSDGGYIMFESNAAMTCMTNIIRENKPFDWTICSANEERQMVAYKGRHEEAITFLQEMESVGKTNVTLTIPTRYVYFFVEKQPIYYYESDFGTQGNIPVSEEGASRRLSHAAGLIPYKGVQRWVTMSHFYYWAQAFAKLYPDAMSVYYEDSDFVCYKLEQNVNSLYNLAIDYGYNS